MKRLLNILADEDVEIITDDEDDGYELPSAHQNYTSKETAINGLQGKLPAIFNLVNFPHGSLILDYGGGRPEAEDLANAFLADKDCEDLVYDEYWTDSSRKSEIRKILKRNGGADVAICSNVLNVIDTYEARIAALQRIKIMTRPGAPVYFTVYEGSRKGEGKASGKDKFQLNRRTDQYLDEIQEVFPDAKRKGKLISATNTSNAVTSSTDVHVDRANFFAANSKKVRECVKDYLEYADLPTGMQVGENEAKLVIRFSGINDKDELEDMCDYIYDEVSDPMLHVFVRDPRTIEIRYAVDMDL